MERNLKTVQGSIEFRDAAMAMDRSGEEVYVRKHGFTGPTYRILPRHADPFQKITMDDLFGSHYAPVYMEDFATALVQAAEADGEVPKVDVFTL